MKYALIASLVSLAIAHPHARPSKPSSLKKRTVDIGSLRYSHKALGTEYTDVKKVESTPALRALVKRADPKDTAAELGMQTQCTKSAASSGNRK